MGTSNKTCNDNENIISQILSEMDKLYENNKFSNDLANFKQNISKDKLPKHLQEYINALYDPDPSERLFPMINKYSLAKALKRTAIAAGIKPIRVHDLRHSHASLLIELGFPPLLISERLGHENIETTLQIYSHLYPNKAEEVAAKLNELL